jgi:hypothetical protein
MVAHNPLHRSGRAAFPHPAPASGDDAKSPQGVGVADSNGWQPSVDEVREIRATRVIALGSDTNTLRVEQYEHLDEEREVAIVAGLGKVDGRVEWHGVSVISLRYRVRRQR